MVAPPRPGHDGAMSDSSSTADTGGFDPGRLRHAPTQMVRSRHDRYIAGVCGGLGRYLDIDPVVVRVVMAALTVVGGLGVVLYLSAWLLTPEEGSTKSLLEEHLPLRPYHRALAWIVAAVIAAGAVIGSGPWFSRGWIGPFPLLGLALLIWLLARPRESAPPEPGAAAAPPTTSPTPPNPPTMPMTPTAPTAPAPTPPQPPSEPTASGDETEADTATAAADETTRIQATAEITDTTKTTETTEAAEPTTPLGPPPGGDGPPATPPGPGPAAPRVHRGGGTLTWLTLAGVLVVIGVLLLIDRSGTDVEGPVYLASGLAVVGAGMVVGTWWGDGRWLIPVGALLSSALLVVSQLPVWKAGEIKEAPTQSAYVLSTYEMGAGRIELDLTHVQDLEALDGRTITIENGMGEIRVVIPDGIDAEIEAEINLGQVKVLGRQVGGSDASTRYADVDDADPNVRFDIAGSLGNVEVIRR